jgi:hypothetical protein
LKGCGSFFEDILMRADFNQFQAHMFHLVGAEDVECQAYHSKAT